jgi:C4-dicarboxylate-specific signal transduction histidine kinase
MPAASVKASTLSGARPNPSRDVKLSLSELTEQLARLSSGKLLALCLALVAAIGLLDYVTDYEISMTLLYLAPIFVAAWSIGFNAAIAMSVISLATWFVAALYAHRLHPDPHVYLFDGAVQFAMFMLFALVIRRLRIALSNADERFATVLEGLDAAVYVSDAKTGDVLYANEQFAKTFPAGSDLPSVPAVHRGEFHDRKRGRWYLVHSRPMRWVDGRMVRLQLATDISERRRAEALLRQQQEKMQITARLVTVGEMATTLAHELNQPLAAITNYTMGCVRRMRSGNWEQSELLEAMEKGAAQAERASRVIQRVRAFVARRAPNLVSCDLNDIVRGVMPMINVEAREHGASVKLELSETIPYVQADIPLMEQVVLNLARNGLEAVHDQAAEDRHITIRSRAGPDETVVLEVADCGPGIDSTLEQNLFTPFFSTKPQGTGLGLHICRSIVEAHGGHVWVSRNADRGVTFHCSLKSVYA